MPWATQIVLCLACLLTSSSYVVEAVNIEHVDRRATTFPQLPPGASAFQLKLACAPSYPITVLGNDQYGGSTLTTAYIVQHGAGSNVQNIFSAVYDIIGKSGIIAAPAMYQTDSRVAPDSWYQPGVNLAWGPGDGTFAMGLDAVAPKALPCSSFDVYDALLSYFNDKTRFAKLKKVVFVSHSGGAGLVSRYSQIFDGAYTYAVRFIVANPPNNAYFTSARPVANPCTAGLNAYPYQLSSNNAPRYVVNKLKTISMKDLFRRWIARDIVTLTGDYDTYSRSSSGLQDCLNLAQGGMNRRDRNFAWWAYQNILAGTSTDVSAYYGYQQLRANGATTIYKGTLNHQNCVIDKVGHDKNAMFASECGRAAMTEASIPAGVGAQYP